MQINFYSVILQFRVLLHVTTHGLREISRTGLTPTFNFLGETFTTNKINWPVTLGSLLKLLDIIEYLNTRKIISIELYYNYIVENKDHMFQEC